MPPSLPTRHAHDTGAVTENRTADVGVARLDVDRAARTGTPEVVYAEGKTPAQTVTCLAGLLDAGAPLAWATRVSPATAAAVLERWPGAHVDPVARVARVGTVPPPVGEVLVLTAGTSDDAVAAEVAATLTASGVGCRRVDDVGVAGMDGALPSVVAGLTDRLVVAVPTSVGYGAAFDGLAALLTMLTACAPGVLVVNIDNGFGAGVAAARIARSAQR